MAFQITQCPSCDSTFNTSPQLLEMAAGKVRCGACLSVFQAQEHFVDVATGNLADEADESVFIGNDPEDFFDPTVFLTRSALQDDQTSTGEPDLISTASTVNPDYSSARKAPKMAELDRDTTISSPQAIAAEETSNTMDYMAAPLTEGLEPTVSGKPLTTAADSPTPAPQSSRLQNDQEEAAAEHFANEAAEDLLSENKTWAEKEEVGTEGEATETTEAETEENSDSRVTVGTGSGAEHAEFFAALEESLDGLEVTDEIAELKAIAELDALGSASKAAMPEQLDENTATLTPAESEAEPSIEKDPAEQTAAEPKAFDKAVTGDSAQESPSSPESGYKSASPTSTPRPEDVSLSISFSVQPPPSALSAKTAAAAATKTPAELDHAEKLDENQDRSANDASLADVDAEAAIEIESGSDSGYVKEDEETFREDPYREDTPPEDKFPEDYSAEVKPAIDELPIGIGEARSAPAFTEPELDPATEFTEKTVILDAENIRAAEKAEQDFNEAIKEQEFAETVASGFAAEETMDSELDSSIDWQLANVGDESGDPEPIGSADEAQNQESLQEPDSFQNNEAGAKSAIEASPETAPDYLTEVEKADAATYDAQGQDSASEPEAEVSSEDIRARAMRAQLQDDEALEQLPEENLAALKVMATPLELGSGQGRRWGATLGLALLACLLGVSIAGQYLWRHNTVYSQQPMLRPLFVTTCQVFGCTLPPYRNLAAIVSSNLSVRSHPERTDAIMINVEMRNTAPFEQPFPIMVLGFNTASNDLIALREFTPEEYLAVGLQGVTQMPVMAPVQVDLALMDPGDDAVNYTLAFRLP